MGRLSESYRTLLEKYSHGRIIIILLILMLSVYLYMLLGSIPKVMGYADGMKLFDMLPTGYSVEYARQLLDNLGPDGRKAYLTSQIPVDMIYPGLFAISWALLLAWMLRKAAVPNRWTFRLCAVPVLAGLFDYLENLGVIGMLATYPDLSPLSVGLACVFTVTKAVLTTLFFVSLIVGVVLAATRRRSLSRTPA